MRGHLDDEQGSDRRATPMRLGRYATRIPSGSGGAGASAACFSTMDTASPASRRLASAPAALGTRYLILGQAPS